MLDIKQIMVDENWSSTKLNSERGSLFRFSISNSLLFLFFILCSFSTIAQVTSSVDSTKIRIGEEILYTINVDADSTDVVEFQEEQTFVRLELIKSFKIKTI